MVPVMGCVESQGDPRIEAFIAHWHGREGGQERANYALFLIGLCDALGLPQPEPAGATTENNDYVFERAVRETQPDGTVSVRRIDLYKRGCFILEAKQSRQTGGAKEVAGQVEPFHAEGARSRSRTTSERSWDVLMMNARAQAQAYARALPVEHGWPPFILVCDVGRVIEVYADFSGLGKNYNQFPDRDSYRIRLDDLRHPAIRERLRRVWTDPKSLDPSLERARVTRQIAERLAAVSKSLEKARKYDAEAVAMFLMRCLFTMFAQSVELLPKESFVKLLRTCEQAPSKFEPMVSQLWDAMNTGAFAIAIEAQVKRFNGEFFASHAALALGREEVGELRAAAECDWRDVDPSIFGTLLEQALDAGERRRLGAHYTPRAYVERLVVATIVEPLRADWTNVLSTVERQKAERRDGDAIATVRAFHERLCKTRILDPACGTGNFLYVALELLKRLEGEVLETLADIGGQEALTSLESHTVGPRQFLGLETNPRAAAISELVLWIGYLQWHIRTKGGPPREPILEAFHNIHIRDAVLTWDGWPAPSVKKGRETYPGARRPEWPAAEFIVGNPPFIGGKDIRGRQGDDYAEALWRVNPQMNESADYVMYWWDRSADVLTRKDSVLRRFGLVTTNSISQVFQRRVVERHMKAKPPMSIVMAIPDHPWTKASADAAAVRIAMTVGEAGRRDGVLREVIREEKLDTDSPAIEFRETEGFINPDLTVGVDVSGCVSLLANAGLCYRGVQLIGDGFIVTSAQAEHLGLGKRQGLEQHIRAYRNGRDLTSHPRGVMAIDLFGLDVDDVRKRFPEVYQHVRLQVKEKTVRSNGKEEKVGRDWNRRRSYRENWWIFGEPRVELRQGLSEIGRYIVTIETMRHRIFAFLDERILPDNKLIVIASDDAYFLGILSARVHICWSLRAGGWLGAGNDPVYVKTSCFDPFPFPAANEMQKQRIRDLAEDLDKHRKRVLNEHPALTLTGLYNVIGELRSGTGPDALAPAARQIFDDGQVLILKELHDRLDAEVAHAYGWPADLSDGEILLRLVALNRQRAGEEAKGNIRWLRPEYQVPRFGTPVQKAELDLVGGETSPAAAAAKEAWPADEIAQTAAVMAVLASATAPLSAEAIAASFRQGRKCARNVRAVLESLTRMGRLDRRGGGKVFRLHRTG